MMEPLTQDEIKRLPEKLRLRYWAGQLGHAVPNLTEVTHDGALADCRRWLQFIDALAPGAVITIDWPGYWAHGKRLTVIPGSTEWGIPVAHPERAHPVVIPLIVIREPPA